MAILQFITKTEVSVSLTRPSEMSKVIMDINTEERNALAIYVSGTYYKETDGSIIESFVETVTNEQANQLGAVPIPPSATLIETRNIQLGAGTLAILSTNMPFGLTANDWETYTPPPTE